MGFNFKLPSFKMPGASGALTGALGNIGKGASFINGVKSTGSGFLGGLKSVGNGLGNVAKAAAIPLAIAAGTVALNSVAGKKDREAARQEQDAWDEERRARYAQGGG